MIKELEEVMENYGDIEVTCTNGNGEEADSSDRHVFHVQAFNMPHETTAENLIVKDDGIFGTRVRIYF
jgi:hypothetical protein